MDDDPGCIRYREIRFSADRLEAILQANAIIKEYAAQGMTMSVRQVYYQLVGTDLIANNDREYDKLQGLINDGRMAGIISWTAIEDRNRQMMSLQTYDVPQQALKAARDRYKRDLWSGQPWRPKVLVEKAALEGVISTICNELRVDFMATRGYNSQSETWRLGMELASCVQKGQRPIVFHLGDHDPSGLDMTRDLRDRLEVFTGVPVMVQRLALNMPQVKQYNPPPNPAKMSDGRAPAYVREYGTSSWELDALKPTVIRDLIRDAIMRVRDEELWSAALAREADDRDTIDIMLENMT